MTSIATLVERLRRATTTSEPERDVAVILSEFIDDGAVEPVDDPFHPARASAVSGPLATLAANDALTVVLVRTEPGIAPVAQRRPVPQRHCLPLAVAAIREGLAVDVFVETEDGSIAEAGTIEILPHEVHVIEPDVVHRIRFLSADDGQALHVVIGDLRSAPRSRWVDGARSEVTESTDYPL